MAYLFDVSWLVIVLTKEMFLQKRSDNGEVRRATVIDKNVFWTLLKVSLLGIATS